MIRFDTQIYDYGLKLKA